MSRSVLIIDDSIVMSRKLAKIVGSFAGYQVMAQAHNGVEGLKRFRELHPDVVLLDIVMPTLGGIECLRAIRQLEPEARVVMISSLGGVGHTVEESLKQGAASVISKPFESAKVLAVLDRLFAIED